MDGLEWICFSPTKFLYISLQYLIYLYRLINNSFSPIFSILAFLFFFMKDACVEGSNSI
jgi:hypothetical protein